MRKCVNVPEKELFYFAATESGDMPTEPRKKPAELISYMPTLKKGWPDKEWKLFKVVRPPYSYIKGDKPNIPRPIIPGVCEEMSDFILEKFKSRFTDLPEAKSLEV